MADNAAAPEVIASGVMMRTDIGLLATLFYITYGLSKFFSGIVSDRSNARYFMGLGLIATGVVNMCSATAPITIGITAPPTLCAVFHNAHQPPRSLREYQLVSRRAQTGAPQPRKKALIVHSSAKAHSAVGLCAAVDHQRLFPGLGRAGLRAPADQLVFT